MSTKDLSCAAKFYYAYYVFQNFLLRMTTGNAKEHGGMYYHEDNPHVNKQVMDMSGESLSCKVVLDVLISLV